MSKLFASKLKHRVTLEQPGLTDDGGGGKTVNWQTLAELWAEVKPLSGSEALIRGIERSRVNYRIRVRYRSDITNAMRIVWEGRCLNIEAVVPETETLRRMVLIYASEGGEA